MCACAAPRATPLSLGPVRAQSGTAPPLSALPAALLHHPVVAQAMPSHYVRFLTCACVRMHLFGSVGAWVCAVPQPCWVLCQLGVRQLHAVPHGPVRCPCRQSSVHPVVGVPCEPCVESPAIAASPAHGAFMFWMPPATRFVLPHLPSCPATSHPPRPPPLHRSPLGRYGNTTNLTTAACSGPCTPGAGRYCTVGLSNPLGDPCVIGQYR
jgi:hypothetical protein